MSDIRYPILTYTPERAEQERTHSAMAAMVDIDSFLLALDDIHMLQSYIERQRETTRVRCTKDGEFPEIGQTVIYVEYGQAHLGKLLFKDDDGHEWQNDTGTQWFLKQTAIYWQPVITSLKEQYEREGGQND